MAAQLPWNRNLREQFAALPATYVDRYDPDKIMVIDEYPAEYFRLEIIKRRVAGSGGTRILDVGVGSGIPAVEIARQQNSQHVVAFDATPEMVEFAQNQFAAAGLSPERVFLGDANATDPFSRAQLDAPFDIILVLGLAHHIENQDLFLRKLCDLLSPNGRVFISFRNKLFSLVTMNRFTHALVCSELLGDDVPVNIVGVVDNDLQNRLRMDKPDLPELEAYSEASYETIQARKHNPLEVDPWFRALGYSNTRLHFYHYHPCTPYLEHSQVPREQFRRAAMKLEGSAADWRGHFLCSAFMVEATV